MCDPIWENMHNYIVHTSNFEHSGIHKNNKESYNIIRNEKGVAVLESLKVVHLSLIAMVDFMTHQR